MIQEALILLAVQLLFLILIRPLVLWYFKINRVTKLLASIDLSLQQLPVVKASQQRSAISRRSVA